MSDVRILYTGQFRAVGMTTRANCPTCHGSGLSVSITDGVPTADRSAAAFSVTSGVCNCVEFTIDGIPIPRPAESSVV